MDVQAVQEFNGETGKWDAVVADAPPVVVEAPAVVESDDDAPKPAVEAKAGKPAEEKPRGKPRDDPEARIGQAIARQREAERRAEDAERRATERERELQALKAPKPAPIAQTSDDPEPSPDDLTKYPEGQFDRQYLKDQASWSARQVMKKGRDDDAARQAQDRVETTFAQKADTFGKKFAEAAKADPDLEKRINRELLQVRPYSLLTNQDKAAIRNIQDPAVRERVAFQCFLADQWIDSEHAVQLVEHLSDPAEFQRLATLPPNLVIRELAKLDLRFGAAPTDSARPAKPIASKAVAPIDPVGSSPHVADDTPQDEDSDEEWLRKENARLLRQRRRG